MTESFKKHYKRLFEVRLLHHFWLDDGATVFDLIPEQRKREERLLSYDVRHLLAVAPTAATAKLLKGLGCLSINTTMGCIAAVPNTVVVPIDTTFEFAVTVQNHSFYNYTALTLRPQKIYEFYHQPEEKAYRFKENVPVLSNLTGVTRGIGLNRRLFLSKEFPGLGALDQVESLYQSSNALWQLTSDQPGAGSQQLNALASTLPVFVHQGDVPATVPPDGLVGVPAHGIQLSDGIPDDVFALIRLSAVRADDGEFSCIDSNGHAPMVNPIFEIRFKNRSTIRQYFKKNTGTLDAIEPEPLPLTFYGNAGAKQKPSEGLVKAVKSGDKITQLVSEIFV